MYCRQEKALNLECISCANQRHFFLLSFSSKVLLAALFSMAIFTQSQISFIKWAFFQERRKVSEMSGIFFNQEIVSELADVTGGQESELLPVLFISSRHYLELICLDVATVVCVVLMPQFHEFNRRLQRVVESKKQKERLLHWQ